MMHIKLKGMTRAAARYNIFAHIPPPPQCGVGQNVKIQLFQNMVMLHIKQDMIIIKRL